MHFPTHETESWEHDRPDWQTEQVDGSFELLGNYKRDSAFRTSRCWSAWSMMTLQSTSQWGYFLLLTTHNNRSGGMSSSSTRKTKQILSCYCFKDKEKVITNFYLQHHVRALWMFLPPLEKVGRYGERFTEVLTLHPILNFLQFMVLLGPKASFEYSLTWHTQVRNGSVTESES